MASRALGGAIGSTLDRWCPGACAEEFTGTELDWPDAATAFAPEEETVAADGVTLEADKAAANTDKAQAKHKTKPIKTRGLKKADLEAGFFFIIFLDVDCVIWLQGEIPGLMPSTSPLAAFFRFRDRRQRRQD